MVKDVDELLPLLLREREDESKNGRFPLGGKGRNMGNIDTP